MSNMKSKPRNTSNAERAESLARAVRGAPCTSPIAPKACRKHRKEAALYYTMPSHNVLSDLHATLDCTCNASTSSTIGTCGTFGACGIFGSCGPTTCGTWATTSSSCCTCGTFSSSARGAADGQNLSVAQTDSRGQGSPASLPRVQVPEVRSLALRAPSNSPAGTGVAWNAPSGRRLQEVGRGQVPRHLLRPEPMVVGALVFETPQCSPRPMRWGRRGHWGRRGRGGRDINVPAHVVRVPTAMYVGFVGVLPAGPAVPAPTRGPVLVQAGVAPPSWWAILGFVAPPIQQLFMFHGGSVHVQAPHGGGELSPWPGCSGLSQNCYGLCRVRTSGLSLASTTPTFVNHRGGERGVATSDQPANAAGWREG